MPCSGIRGVSIAYKNKVYEPDNDLFLECDDIRDVHLHDNWAQVGKQSAIFYIHTCVWNFYYAIFAWNKR